MKKIVHSLLGCLYFTFVFLNPVFAEVKKDKQLIEKVKEIAKYDLKDPDSAKLRNVRVVTKPAQRDEAEINTNVCGELNAKNSYGAYVGYVKFIWFPGSGSIALYDGKKDIPMLKEKYNELIDYVCGE